MMTTPAADELIPLIENVIEAQNKVMKMFEKFSQKEAGVIRLGGLRPAWHLIAPPWDITEKCDAKTANLIRQMAKYKVLDVNTIISLVENHCAVAILTKIILPVTNNRIKMVPLCGMKPKVLGLLYLTANHRTRIMKKFLTLAETYFRENQK